MYDRFSGIKFWSSERNTENSMSHLYSNEKSDYFKVNTYENEVFCSTIERNSLIYYIQYENRKSRLEQIPEAATWGILRTNVFFKMSQNSQETPVPEETPVNFVKFLKTPLLQNNSGRLLLKCGHFHNEARDIDCICCRELDALLYCFG